VFGVRYSKRRYQGDARYGNAAKNALSFVFTLSFVNPGLLVPIGPPKIKAIGVIAVFATAHREERATSDCKRKKNFVDT